MALSTTKIMPRVSSHTYYPFPNRQNKDELLFQTLLSYPDSPTTPLILSLDALKDKRLGTVISVVSFASKALRQPIRIAYNAYNLTAETKMNCSFHHSHHA
jgi:hypothetical protein